MTHICHADPRVSIQMVALLRELISAKTIHSKYMDSKVAHSTAQRFNTEVRHTYGGNSIYQTNFALYNAET